MQIKTKNVTLLFWPFQGFWGGLSLGIPLCFWLPSNLFHWVAPTLSCKILDDLSDVGGVHLESSGLAGQAGWAGWNPDQPWPSWWPWWCTARPWGAQSPEASRDASPGGAAVDGRPPHPHQDHRGDPWTVRSVIILMMCSCFSLQSHWMHKCLLSLGYSRAPKSEYFNWVPGTPCFNFECNFKESSQLFSYVQWVRT